MRSLIERHGGIATVARSMREVPLEENSEAFQFVESLQGGRIDVVIFMTGVGARALLNVVETRGSRREFLDSLDRCTTIVRGPKPTAVLREWKVHIDHRAAEPNTWRELLAVIDAAVPLEGKKVAVQEYGEPNEEFYRGLKQRGADVLRVPVYRWAFPEDTGPLVGAVRETIAGGFDVLMFTSANQLTNVIRAAEQQRLRDEWVAAARDCVVASIGPTASETLRAAGLTVDVEASPTTMGRLVIQAVSAAPAILARKGAEHNRRTGNDE